MIRISAPGKMILLGEYAVLHGAPALVYAVNRRAQVQLARIDGNEFRVCTSSLNIPAQNFVCTQDQKVRFDPDLNPTFKKRLQLFSRLFESLLKQLDIKLSNQSFSMDMETGAFYDQNLHSKLGFGSSSALTVALTKAVLTEISEDDDLEKVFTTALEAHHYAQGKLGSGIDVAASTYGGVLQYKRAIGQHEKVIKPLPLWQDLPMAVVWSGHSASTTKMVQGVSKLEQDRPQIFKQHMQNLTLLSQQGLAAYSTRDRARFLEIINAYCECMDALGNDSRVNIISQVHRELAMIARSRGAAYKPSGAGGGDIGLLFAKSAQELQEIKATFLKKSVRFVDVQADPNGVINY